MVTVMIIRLKKWVFISHKISSISGKYNKHLWKISIDYIVLSKVEFRCKLLFERRG